MNLKNGFEEITALVKLMICGVNSSDVLQIMTEENDGYGNLPVIFPELTGTKKISINETPVPINENFKFIFGNLPLGAKAATTDEQGRIVHKNLGWLAIYYTSKCLSEDGLGLYLVEPLGFFGAKGKKFLTSLNEEGAYVTGYIRLPKCLFEKHTSIEPILAIVQKKQVPFQLYDISKQNSVTHVVNSLLSGDTCNAKGISLDSFRGFKSIEIENQIRSLDTIYKTYSNIKFNSLIKELNHGKTGVKFKDLDNCIYLKKLGNNIPIITSITEITGRLDNYIQIQIDSNVSNNYLKIFFKSSLGRLILDNATKSTFLARLDIHFLQDTYIPLPSNNTQQQIIETDKRFELLKREIQYIQNEISVNPQSSSALFKVDQMLEITNSLSNAQKLKSLIINGESKTLEFKQTFEYCIKRKTREKDIELSALKTIAGFLNSEGGTLLIGVHDNGMILGVANEMEKFHKSSNDKFTLHVKSKIKARLGVFALNFIEMTIVEVDDNCVFKVECLPSNEEIFIDNKEFYVRTSPSTDKLEGRDLSTYVKNRFG